MKIMRKIIEIDEELCDGCGECIPSCPEGALQIIDGKARLVREDFCDGLGACLGNCPQGAIRIVEKEAQEFDERAVEETQKLQEPAFAGCPSAALRTIQAQRPITGSQHPGEKAPSALSHWPVQIRLVPPQAPFLKKAHLLVAADCTPIAYPSFHQDFLEGKVVMMGCPKFDDVKDYVARFAAIFREAQIQRVTVLVMEVPCCSGLPLVIKKGMELAKVDVPMEVVVIGIEGEVLQRRSPQKAHGMG